MATCFEQSSTSQYLVVHLQWSVCYGLFVQDASKIQYYESFAGLLKHTHGMFIGVANGSNLVAAIDKLLGTNEPFKADINWAGAIQQVGLLVA